mmetsp:Transcript_1065/g.2440  ORF Transcript_1065/g.2440 Transcript_1065/m.2440 type:complete len:109 (+) Transcript_1065:8-334(+)
MVPAIWVGRTHSVKRELPNRISTPFSSAGARARSEGGAGPLALVPEVPRSVDQGGAAGLHGIGAVVGTTDQLSEALAPGFDEYLPPLSGFPPGAIPSRRRIPRSFRSP